MTSHSPARAHFIPQGHDRYAAQRGLGITRLNYKVASSDADGRLFVTEQTMLAKGGPPRHLHLEQEEWFYSLEGEFVIEVGDERFTLGPGDSAFAPRKIPHVLAFIGAPPGRLLIAFSRGSATVDTVTFQHGGHRQRHEGDRHRAPRGRPTRRRRRAEAPAGPSQ